MYTIVMKDQSKTVNTQPRVAKAAIVVIASVLLSRIVGLLREVTVAYYYHVSPDLDAYNAAMKITEILMYVIAGGAISSTFIPTFQKYLIANDEEGAWETFSIVANVAGLATIGLVLISELCAPMLVHVMNPGYLYGTHKFTTAVGLARIVLPGQVFFIIGSLVMGVHNARRNFLFPALAPTIYNLGIIIGAIIAAAMHAGIYGLAWGALIGAFSGSFLLQIYGLRHTNSRYRPLWSLHHPGAAEVWTLLLPVILSVQFQTVDSLIYQACASKLGDGAQSIIGYANRLVQFPIAMIAQTLGIAIFPLMTSLANTGRYDALRSTVNRGLRTVLFFAIPASALLYILAPFCVAVILQHGKFTVHDTQLIATAFRFFLIGISGWSMLSITSRGFLALKESKMYVITSTVAAVLYGLTSWYIIRFTDYGINGLILADSVIVTLLAMTLFFQLRLRLKGIQIAMLIRSTAKTCIATACLSVIALTMRNYIIDHTTSLSALYNILIIVMSSTAGIAAFILTAKLTHSAELNTAFNISRRVVRKLSMTTAR